MRPSGFARPDRRAPGTIFKQFPTGWEYYRFKSFLQVLPGIKHFFMAYDPPRHALFTYSPL